MYSSNSILNKELISAKIYAQMLSAKKKGSEQLISAQLLCDENLEEIKPLIFARLLGARK